MKRLLLPALCALALSACQSMSGQKIAAEKVPENAIEITGGVSTTMSNEPIVPSDPSVQVFSLDGPVENPLSADRTHSVLDNTTAGGYTVFDESVTVYPLPGDVTAAPAYVPDYSVPPLVGQYKPEPPLVGTKKIGLASAGMLPPVPNVEVGEADPFAKPPVAGAVRKPLMLTAPEPLTMQPPTSATPAPRSPFMKADAAPAALAPQNTSPALAPQNKQALLTQDDAPVAPAAAPAATPAPAVTSVTTPGRRSGPSLTGY